MLNWVEHEIKFHSLGPGQKPKSRVFWWSPFYEQHHKNTCQQGFRPGLSQTGLLSHRRWLEVCNFWFSEQQEELYYLRSLTKAPGSGAQLLHSWSASELHHKENQQSAYAKTKTQISFMVTTKLISTFVFATWIVQYLYFLNTKFQASSHLQWLHSLVCVRPGQNPHCWFSHVAAHLCFRIRKKQVSSCCCSYILSAGTFNLVLWSLFIKPRVLY